MKERELIRRTAFYLNLLDNGINPYTGVKIEGAVFSDERLRAALGYAAKYLSAACEDEAFYEAAPSAVAPEASVPPLKNAQGQGKNAHFDSPPETPEPAADAPVEDAQSAETAETAEYAEDESLRGIVIEPSDISERALLDKLNATLPPKQRLKPKRLEAWLCAQGLLKPRPIAGVTGYESTDLSAEYGIFMQTGFRSGARLKNMLCFSSEGQRFIIANTERILAFAPKPPRQRT